MKEDKVRTPKQRATKWLKKWKEYALLHAQQVGEIEELEDELKTVEAFTLREVCEAKVGGSKVPRYRNQQQRDAEYQSRLDEDHDYQDAKKTLWKLRGEHRLTTVEKQFAWETLAITKLAWGEDVIKIVPIEEDIS